MGAGGLGVGAGGVGAGGVGVGAGGVGPQSAIMAMEPSLVAELTCLAKYSQQPDVFQTAPMHPSLACFWKHRAQQSLSIRPPHCEDEGLPISVDPFLDTHDHAVA